MSLKVFPINIREKKLYFLASKSYGAYFLYCGEKVLSENEINAFIIFPNNFINPFVKRHRYNDI